ncbi:hypothetical protein D3C76_1550470 [compost metagenome]
MVQIGGRAAAVHEDQVIDDRVELVPLKPQLVIDQRSLGPQFLDEDPIPQALCRQQVRLVSGEPRFEIRALWRHLGALNLSSSLRNRV